MSGEIDIDINKQFDSTTHCLLCCRFRLLDELRQFGLKEVLSLLQGFYGQNRRGGRWEIIVVRDIWPLLLLAIPSVQRDDEEGQRGFAERLGLLLARRCILVEEIFYCCASGNTIQEAISRYKDDQNLPPILEGNETEGSVESVSVRVMCVNVSSYLGAKLDEKRFSQWQREIEDHVTNTGRFAIIGKKYKQKEEKIKEEGVPSTSKRKSHVTRLVIVATPFFVCCSKEISRGKGKALAKRYGHRPYLTPTVMDPALALLMNNMAQVRINSFVYDPFVGSGSILLGSGHYGAVTFGSDITCNPKVFENFMVYRLPPPELFQSNILAQPFAPTAVFDAIVCDPPYGVRAHASTHSRKGSRSGNHDTEEATSEEGEAASPSEKRRLLAGAEELYLGLFKLAEAHLKPDGKLVFWIPVANEVMTTEKEKEKEGEVPRGLMMETQEGIFLEEAMRRHPSLELLHACRIEAKNVKAEWGRVLVTINKKNDKEIEQKETDEEVMMKLDREESFRVWESEYHHSFFSPHIVHRKRSKEGTTLPASTEDDEEDSASEETESDEQETSMRDLARREEYTTARSQLMGISTDVWRAAWKGDTEAIQDYLKAGGAVDARDKNKTPLFYASGYGKLASVQLLVEHGADVNALNGLGKASKQTALQQAARFGRTEVTAYLCSKGANLATLDIDKNSALSHAAMFGHADVVRVLLDCDSQLGLEMLCLQDCAGRTPLHRAAQFQSIEALEVILEKYPQCVDVQDSNKRTPLFIAARWGHEEVCKLLIRHNANVNATDAAHNTALHEAILWGRVKVAEALIAEGRIDTSIVNEEGKEALDLATPEFLHSFFVAGGNNNPRNTGNTSSNTTGNTTTTNADEDRSARQLVANRKRRMSLLDSLTRS